MFAAAGTFVVERVGRRTLLAVGGSIIAASMALLAVLLAAVPMGPALLPVALVLLCVNRVALTCTLQPLAATGDEGCQLPVMHCQSIKLQLTCLAARWHSPGFATQHTSYLSCKWFELPKHAVIGEQHHALIGSTASLLSSM